MIDLKHLEGQKNTRENKSISDIFNLCPVFIAPLHTCPFLVTHQNIPDRIFLPRNTSLYPSLISYHTEVHISICISVLMICLSWFPTVWKGWGGDKRRRFWVKFWYFPSGDKFLSFSLSLKGEKKRNYTVDLMLKEESVLPNYSSVA